MELPDLLIEDAIKLFTVEIERLAPAKIMVDSRGESALNVARKDYAKMQRYGEHLKTLYGIQKAKAKEQRR